MYLIYVGIVIAVVVGIFLVRSGKGGSLGQKINAATGGKEVIYAPKGKWQFAYGKPNPNLQTDADGNVFFDWSSEEPHYLLFGTGPVDATKKMVVRYKIEVLSGNPVFTAQDQPSNAAPKTGEIAMIVQRKGDNLSAKGDFEHYRWWAQSRYKLAPGEHYLEYSMVPADGLWKSVYTASCADKTKEYLAALKDAGNIGLTFGGWGAGHGVKVSGGKVRFTILEFGVK